MKILIFVRSIIFGITILFVLSACGNGDNSQIPSNVDGYWQMGELTHEDVVLESSNHEFMELRFINYEDANERFEIRNACGDNEVLGTGVATPDGLIYFVSGPEEEEELIQYAEFTGEHEIEFNDSVGEQRIVMQRVTEPDCNALFQNISSGESQHPVAFITESAGAIVHSSPEEKGPANGLDHLNDARGARLPLGHEVDKATNDDAPTNLCQNPDGTPAACPASPDASHAGLVECSVQNWTKSRQASTNDVVALLDLSEIYPGALLQGNSFAAGGFTPITIPRSGGGLNLSGLSIAGSHHLPLNTVSRGVVDDAINNFLFTNDILGTTADFSFKTVQSYSANEFAVSLGISASVESYPAKISGQLEVSTDSIENVIVTQFEQVYYTVNYEVPERPFSVFRDGEDFADPDDQIGGDNPPLYVSGVKYGRQIMFFLRSSYGANIVKAAMQGAISAEAATAEASAGLTNKTVMENTTVTYVVRGGDAGTALGPIDSATPAEMYDAIKAVIANPKVATYSASSPGVPIAYTLKYLTDNRTAMTSYATTYDRRDCRVYPDKDFDYKLRISHPSYKGWVNLDKIETFGKGGVIAGPFTKDTDLTIDLNDDIADKADHVLILTAYSVCGAIQSFTSGAKWSLIVDGSTRWTDKFHKNYFQCLKSATIHPTGLQYEAKIVINRATGKRNVISIDK